jgi:uncharacterized protein (DUF2147 family)
MKLTLRALICCISYVLLSSFSTTNNPDIVVGFWRTGDGKAVVQIYKESEKYFGKIIWLAEPNDPATGQAKVDKKNEDEKLRNRPLIGLVNLRNFEFIKNKLWENGKIYDPKSGEDYSCTIKMLDDNTLEVRGYVGISMFGRTDTWKRQKVK